MSSKEYKELYEAALADNSKLIDLINEIQSESGVIIKLEPDSDATFYYNDDPIMDEAPAIYRGMKLNKSEVIVYKAGKEAARREFEKQLEDLRRETSDIVEQLRSCKANLNDSADYVSTLKKDIAVQQVAIEHMKASSEEKLSAQATSYELTIASLKEQLSVQKEVCRKMAASLESSYKLTDEPVNVSTDVYTMYGLVKGEGSCE